MGFANKTGLGCGAGTPLKRRMRALVLAVCLLALAGIALFRARQAASSLLGAPLADSGRVASITALTRQTGDDCALLWNGAELPYDAETDAYCLPQPLNGGCGAPSPPAGAGSGCPPTSGRGTGPTT